MFEVVGVDGGTDAVDALRAGGAKNAESDSVS